VIRHAAEKGRVGKPSSRPTVQRPVQEYAAELCVALCYLQLKGIDRAGMAVKIFTMAHQALPASAGGDAAQNVRLRASRKK